MPLRLGFTLRFGAFGTSLSSLVCALMAIWGAVSGKGPFVASSPLENALSMQLFLIVSHISLMLLAAVMAESNHSARLARTNERQLELALAAARLVSWEWHIGTDRTRGSRAVWDMLGIPEPSGPTSERYLECVHPDDRHIVRAAIADGIAGIPFDVEYRIVHPDGTIHWLLTRGTTAFDDTGAAERVVGVNVDITERKRAESEIQERQREVAHLGRVAVVGELSIALTHELRQPLAAILANANAGQRLLSHTPPKIDEIREILADIAADDARAAAVITRLRTLLRNEPVSRETMDVNQAVREALVIARADLAWRNVSVETRLAPRLPTIDADRVQVQQVLLNLVINACEAMENGHAGSRRLLISTSAPGAKMVEITVSDTGPGIPADRLEEIFAPFVTTKPSGLGLGLSICRSIVSAQGGRLHASNNSGGGAAFHLSMPATRARDAG
jgi:C4-dicarboxylate-specific signal transduction histidine kinase